MTIDDLLREAEEQQRRELEEMAQNAIELRARLPHIVEEAVKRDRERITVALDDQTDLSQREIAAAVGHSHAWVSQTLRQAEPDR